MKTTTGMEVALGKRQSLPEELAAIIMRRIEGGELRPGDILPSEQALADMFTVSRTVVREALARLKYEGIIESKRGSGPIVKGLGIGKGFTVNLDDLSAEELRQFLEFRVIVEGEGVAMAAVRRTPEQLMKLRGHLDDIRKAVDEGASGTEPDYLFHRLLADSAANSYLGEFVKFLSTKIWLGVYCARWKSNQVTAQAEQVYSEHEAIYLAVEAGDPHRARAALQRHLRNSAKRQGALLDDRFLAPGPDF